MRRCVSLFHIWRAELGNLTCYVGHHNVLCLPLWQGVFFYLRYKDTAFFAGGQISAIELTRFSARIDAIFASSWLSLGKADASTAFSLAYSQPSARAVGVCEITPLSKRLVEFVESVEFVETQTADFEQVIPLSTNSTNSTNGKKTDAVCYIIIQVK